MIDGDIVEIPQKRDFFDVHACRRDVKDSCITGITYPVGRVRSDSKQRLRGVSNSSRVIKPKARLADRWRAVCVPAESSVSREQNSVFRECLYLLRASAIGDEDV